MRMSTQEKKRKHDTAFRRVLLGFVGVFVAFLCCLPVLAVALGTLGGLGVIIGLAAYRLPLTIVGIGVFAFGIYQYHRAKNRNRCQRREK